MPRRPEPARHVRRRYHQVLQDERERHDGGGADARVREVEAGLVLPGLGGDATRGRGVVVVVGMRCGTAVKEARHEGPGGGEARRQGEHVGQSFG